MYCEGIMWRRRVTNFLSGHREISDVLRTAAVLPVLWGGERGGGCEDSLRICVARSPCCPLSRVDIAGGKHGTVRTGEPAHQPLSAASPSLLVVLENDADGNPQISVWLLYVFNRSFVQQQSGTGRGRGTSRRLWR